MTTTQYAGAYIYENSSLKFASHAGGYIEPDGTGGYNYVYQYKDHLGNVRLSYSDTNEDGIVETSEIMSEKNYYPFGLFHRGYNIITNGVENKHFTYNGKELEEDLDINWTDYGTRRYVRDFGKWVSIDSYAEKYETTSPYAYVTSSRFMYRSKVENPGFLYYNSFADINNNNYSEC